MCNAIMLHIIDEEKNEKKVMKLKKHEIKSVDDDFLSITKAFHNIDDNTLSTSSIITLHNGESYNVIESSADIKKHGVPRKANRVGKILKFFKL